jgi:general stress protein 26
VRIVPRGTGGAGPAAAAAHLRGIIDDRRALSATDITSLLTGMKVVAVATVTARAEPRISAVDGHFLHGTWTWGTSGASAKARDLQARPAVSVAHIDHEDLAVFAHGQAGRLEPADPLWEETLAHWTAHYGGSPLDWGADIRLYRLDASWMVGYASDREQLLATRTPEHGVAPAP